HGAVMQMEPNIWPIVKLFPRFTLEEADGMWCAAFVYYCCKKAGFIIPTRPNECTASLAGCLQWEEWAMGDNRVEYFKASDDFAPEAGDIVLFDNVFIGREHDHIGIVIEDKGTAIVVAEGNINNVSGVVERKKDTYVRGYIRIPDNYEYGM
ncbi:MAG: CHAP domain-containing protein, partial [Defluviitaleaceae bacterium]|nr:CHAP domain-containing protein [Defluviitaleaceae bacterium]